MKIIKNEEDQRGKESKNYDENNTFRTYQKNTNLPANYPQEIKEFANSVKSELIGSDFQKIHPT